MNFHMFFFLAKSKTFLECFCLFVCLRGAMIWALLKCKKLHHCTLSGFAMESGERNQSSLYNIDISLVNLLLSYVKEILI